MMEVLEAAVMVVLVVGVVGDNGGGCDIGRGCVGNGS